MSIGFRVMKRRRKVDAGIAAKYRDVPLANVSDCMHRMTAGGPALRPMYAIGGDVATPMAGPALTVKTRPSDNLMVHQALLMIEPGDIIVVDAGGDPTIAIIGELMAALAEKRGAGGMVIYGGIRDCRRIGEEKFPVYATGVTHRGPFKEGPGEINVPIAIDGMVIEPGDLVIGDDDGILCVPYDHVETVYEEAHAKSEKEKVILERILSGEGDLGDYAGGLKTGGCYFEE